jgi:hypothetical protein
MLLEPQVHQIDWNDFSRVDEAFAAGAQAMRRALPSLQEIIDRSLELATPKGMKFSLENGLAI